MAVSMLALGAPLHIEYFLRAASGTFERLELVIRPGRMRLKTCEVHRTAAITQRQQERVAQRSPGRRYGHGSSLRWFLRRPQPRITPDKATVSQTIDPVWFFFGR